MEYNPQKSVWFNSNIEYLFNVELTEFDLKDAGYNLIKEYKLLPSEEIERLSKMDKGVKRHIEIGMIQKNNPEFSKKLQEKFADMRYIFINSNNLKDDDIVSVKKDALFIIGQVKNKKFGKLEFRQKNVYSSYLRFPNIQNLEIYWNNIQPDIKGMTEHAINRHRLYMYNFINEMIKLIENNSPSVKRKMLKFISDYKYNLLDEGYYLEFNRKSTDINPIFNFKNIIVPLVQIITKEVS